VKDIIKTYEKELDDVRPMYVIMSDDGMFFKDHGENGTIETNDDPWFAFTWDNDEHADLELIEYENRFKKTKKKWRVVAMYENKKITHNITER
jgi:hypothetical protein